LAATSESNKIDFVLYLYLCGNKAVETRFLLN